MLESLRKFSSAGMALLALLALAIGTARAQQKQPNILVIWGDDAKKRRASRQSDYASLRRDKH